MGSRRKSSSRSNKTPRWVWFLNLGFAAAFTYFLFYLKKVPTESPVTADTADFPQSTQKKQKSNAKPGKESNLKTQSDNQPRFTFYETLPESKVAPTTVDAYKPNSDKQHSTYLLQTGSFRRFQDAEKQRATIAFQGLKAAVDSVSLSEGSTWYRVQLGPYSSRSKMNKAIDKLVAINIQPLVKKQAKTK